MFLGHAAVGLAAKRWSPKTSLGWLLTAPFLADMLWPLFLLLGWEEVRVDPAHQPIALDFVSYPWSHSLLMMVVWGVALGSAYFFARDRDKAGGAVVGALVVSHWVLDWVTHRPDLPVIPLLGPNLGLGLWYSQTATVVTEVALFLTGLGMYLSKTRARSWQGHLSLWLLVAVLALAYWGDQAGPPPPSAEAVARFGLVGFLFVPWAIWIDKTRVVRSSLAA